MAEVAAARRPLLPPSSSSSLRVRYARRGRHARHARRAPRRPCRPARRAPAPATAAASPAMPAAAAALAARATAAPRAEDRGCGTGSVPGSLRPGSRPTAEVVAAAERRGPLGAAGGRAAPRVRGRLRDARRVGFGDGGRGQRRAPRRRRTDGGSRGGVGGEKEIEWEGEGVNVEDSNFGGVFCIYSCHVAPYQGVWT